MSQKELEVVTDKPLATTQDATITPMHLLQVAMNTEGVDLDRLERLMLMQTQYEEKQAKKEFIEAIASFKAECPIIAKLTNGQSKKYADLATIAEAVDPILSKNGLSYRWDQSQDTEKKELTITCVVTHVGGHSERTPLTAGMDAGGNKNAIQALGSSNSYLCRYTLNAALGLASKEFEDDGKGTTVIEYINEDQWRELDTLVSQQKTKTMDEICKSLRVSGLDVLPVNKFASLKKRLNEIIKEEANQ